MSERPPLFTVIMPTYQRATMLPSAVQTLLDQTCQDYECIIVDDSSTDGTEAVVRGLRLPPKFSYFRLEGHPGNMYCRNRALERSRGVWITYLDTDDFYLPERLTEFKKAIEARPEVGFWYSNGYTHRFGRILARVFDPESPVPEGKLPGWYAVGDRLMPYLTTNIAIPSALYKKYGLYRKDMVILDNELYARMLADGVLVGAIKRPLAVRRIHEAQVTHLWLKSYPENVEALKASDPPREVFEREKLALIEDYTAYVLKAPEPLLARQFLLETLGEKATRHPLYRWTFVPVPLLKALKRLNRWRLIVRRHPAWAPADFKAAMAYIQPLIDQEESRIKNRPVVSGVEPESR